jgi:hypothetical protein
MTVKVDILRLFDLQYRDPEPSLKAIAEILRGPDIDPLFLEILAECIDPDVKDPETKVKLVVRRIAGAGAPEKNSPFDLMMFLEIHIDFFGEKTDAVFAEAKARFGVGRTKCNEALKEIRQIRDLFPNSFVSEKEIAISKREAGDPDYQPLWPDK